MPRTILRHGPALITEPISYLRVPWVYQLLVSVRGMLIA